MYICGMFLHLGGNDILECTKIIFFTYRMRNYSFCNILYLYGMQWKINKAFKSGRDTYRVFLNVDKALNPFTFTFPVVWSGSVSGDVNNITPLERGEIQLKQNSYASFEAINFPEFASGVYNQILEEIDRELKRMD